MTVTVSYADQLFEEWVRHYEEAMEADELFDVEDCEFEAGFMRYLPETHPLRLPFGPPALRRYYEDLAHLKPRDREARMREITEAYWRFNDWEELQ